MSKTVNEVLGKAKGVDNVNTVMTGKGAFSQAGFADLVNALANDTSYKIPTYGKDGKKNGEVSVSELIRDDLKTTVERAKYPQKSEAAVLDTCPISTNGLAKAIPYVVMEQIASGKKFDLPAKERVNGSIYLADVEGKTKETSVRNPADQTPMGTVTTTTKDWIQVRAKSSAPAHLQTKVRKDVNGKIVK